MDPETTDLVDEIIAGYIRSEEAGKPLDRDQLIAENPAIADELREFFADRERFRRLAPPLDGKTPRRQFVPPAVPVRMSCWQSRFRRTSTAYKVLESVDAPECRWTCFQRGGAARSG